MRLADVLSKPCNQGFVQIEGFLGNQKLSSSRQKKLLIGRIALNYFCKNCLDDRTFLSSDELFCIGVNDHLVSIDCVLKCPCCDSSVQVWFLVESDDDIYRHAPNVRIMKRSEKLSEMVLFCKNEYDDFSELLEKAQRAYRDGMGAGAIVYLRKILERVTQQAADAAHIDVKTPKNKRKTFKSLLEEVDQQKKIIPKEFSANGYKLFGELSDVVHGDYDEQLGLQKYEALHRLVVGVLDNVKNNRELMAAIGSLGWENGDESGGSENEPT